MSEKVRKIEAKIRRVNDDAAAALKLETDAKAAEEEYEMKRRASAGDARGARRGPGPRARGVVGRSAAPPTRPSSGPRRIEN